MAGVEHLALLEPRENSPLQAVVDAFLLSKEAARCTPRTLEHYTYTLGACLEFLQCAGVMSLREIAPDYIRRYVVNTALWSEQGGSHDCRDQRVRV